MKHVENFLEDNGLSQAFLCNSKYKIKTNVVFKDGTYTSDIEISGLELTGFAYPDAIIMLDLYIKVFYIQWKEQYKTREYARPENGKKYSVQIEINNFDFKLESSSGFGWEISPKFLNLMLMITMVSLPNFVRQNYSLEYNPFRGKFLDFMEDFENYVDMSEIYAPNTMLYKSIRNFFDLGDIQYIPENTTSDGKQAVEIFRAFIEKEEKWILESLED